MYKYLSWIAVISWMGLIFFLSHQPADASSELSSGFMEIILRPLMILFPNAQFEIDWLHFFIRKNAHFFAYFILGILYVNALKASFKDFEEKDWKLISISLFLSILYAISDEVHQLFIPGRSGEVRDIFIDSSGAFTGIIIYVKIVLKIYERRNRNVKQKSA